MVDIIAVDSEEIAEVHAILQDNGYSFKEADSDVVDVRLE